MKDRLLCVPVWVIIGVCCALPLGWLLGQVVLNPHTLAELRMDAFRLRLLGRTVLFNGAAAVGAVLLALPVAMILGRSRGLGAKLLWLVLPVSLLLPSLAYAYGWSQFVRLLDVPLEPGGVPDIARCIWTLATWLWPIPAAILALALRRIDPHVLEQASLDGGHLRVLLRQLVSPMIASFCIVMVLAVQEFAVYEPTGISVIATEVRMVFETGAFSSATNPITQTLGQSGGDTGLADQRARAGAAVAASLPLLGVIALLCIVSLIAGRRLAWGEPVDVPKDPAAQRLGVGVWVISWGVVAIAVGVPLVSMWLSLHRSIDPSRLWSEFSPQILGSLAIAGTAGFVALLVALGACDVRTRVLPLVASITFLIGGQLVAIALIRAFNRPWLMWAYNGLPVIVIAHVARFGWLPLLAGRATWSREFQQVRDLATLDGASRLRATVSIIWPIALPTLVASAVLVMVLALTEVPATVLLSPQRPQPLIPLMMTWVHMLRYDAMIEASLVLCGIVVVLAIGATVLFRVGLRIVRDETRSTKLE